MMAEGPDLSRGPVHPLMSKQWNLWFAAAAGNSYRIESPKRTSVAAGVSVLIPSYPPKSATL
jgi:hypothetical protein